MDMNDIVYLMCECYIYPTYFWSTLGYGTEHQGKCGRCGKSSIKLSNMINTKEEALEVYFENYGHYPKPIGKTNA